MCERLIGRWHGPGRYDEILGLGADAALDLLDRFDSNTLAEVAPRGVGNPTAEASLLAIQSLACSWARHNLMRSAAIEMIVNMVRRIEAAGAEVNIAALARMAAISRQTLHTRLRPAQQSRAEKPASE
ncbi:hypothetical protein ACPCAE_22530 [Streptomyces cinereoruber]|uniref:hypothetical protein n=1 Tax=Streptomyces cinereoruber TaxID=67260 RepID=UPI003C2DBA49